VAGAVVVTVSVKVAACITDPDVAVTVTVVAVGVVDVPEVGSPAPVCDVGLLLHPTNKVIAATLIGSSMTSLRPRRVRLRTKHSATASDEPESNSPEPARMEAVDTAVFTVSVELIEPVDDTVTGEKLHVAPAGNPAQVNVTAELVEKPFCGSTVTAVVALLPAFTVTEFGVTASMKSGAGAPAAGIRADAWFELADGPLESTASTT
jgi:hypothetical protein